MSLEILLNDTTHEFTKINSVTKRDRSGHYDQLRCKKCNLQGKRRHIDRIEIDGRSSPKTSRDCPKVQSDVPKKVRITNFNGFSDNFANIIADSVHEVIDAPEEFRKEFPNSSSTVWISGVYEPARLLSREFEVVE